MITPSRDCSRYEDIDEKLERIAISLKRLAKELHVPVIVVDQLDQTEGLVDAYPLSEIADVVMFLDHAKDNDGSGEGTSGELWLPMDIYIAKFRQGPMGGTMKFSFEPRTMTFIEED